MPDAQSPVLIQAPRTESSFVLDVALPDLRDDVPFGVRPVARDALPNFSASSASRVTDTPSETSRQERLLPWGLLGHPGLSYGAIAAASLRAIPALVEDVGGKRPGSAALAARNALPAAPLQGLQVTDGAVAIGASPVGVLAMHGARSTPVGRSAASADVSETPLNIEASAWAERHLQWQGDAESTTAFARDYRLASEAVPALIDFIRSAAAGLPAPLRRIVFNGREVWRAVPSNRSKGA